MNGVIDRAAFIETKAPGKLFIVGEYAVVEPGEPAVLVAVDRFLTVRLTRSEGAGRVHSPEYGNLPLVWRRDGTQIVADHHPYDYVMSALSTVDRLRAERGLAPAYFDLHITSELDDPSGRKFGLGSSAAVVVATIQALDAFYGLGLSIEERFKLSLLTAIQVAPKSSGGDIAASTYGGWIRYTAPDRFALRAYLSEHLVSETLQAPAWDDFSVRALPAPAEAALLVGWTGSPASTEALVDGMTHRSPSSHPDFQEFLAASRDSVESFAKALETGDTETQLQTLRRVRRLLQRLGKASGTLIETDTLRLLCESAESVGAAAKPSGAGGGDCGIVLAPNHVDAATITDVWTRNEIRPLDLHVHGARPGVDSGVNQ
ncbi:MAG: phosphomevalonate kinase [Galactobacter sp.]